MKYIMKNWSLVPFAKKISILALMIFSSVVYADQVTSIPTSIEATNDGIIVRGEGFTPIQHGCTVDKAVFIPATHEHYQFLKAAALAALMGDKKLSYNVINCYDNTYMSIYARSSFIYK